MMRIYLILLLVGLTGWGCAKAPVRSPSDNEKPSVTNTGEVAEMKLVEVKSGDWSPGLSEEEKQTLYAIALDTLDWCVKGSKGAFEFSRYDLTPLLKKEMATFVTLKEKGQLRGCIGSLAPVAPLYESVHDNAVNAALKDFRFHSVRPEELPQLHVYVSILSPIATIPSYKEFRIGEHGVILSKHGRRAVFLPEVAPEQGWSVAQTLEHLSMKAGLPHDAWKEGASYQVFSSVEIYAEDRED